MNAEAEAAALKQAFYKATLAYQNQKVRPMNAETEAIWDFLYQMVINTEAGNNVLNELYAAREEIRKLKEERN